MSGTAWLLLTAALTGAVLILWWFLDLCRAPRCACGREPIIAGCRVVDTSTGMLHTPYLCGPIAEGD